MRGESVRIVAGGTRQGQDAAGLDLDDHCGAVVAAELLVGELLQLGVDGRLDGRALVLDAGEQRFQLIPEQRVRLAAQQLVADDSMPRSPRWVTEKKPVTGAYTGPFV